MKRHNSRLKKREKKVSHKLKQDDYQFNDFLVEIGKH